MFKVNHSLKEEEVPISLLNKILKEVNKKYWMWLLKKIRVYFGKERPQILVEDLLLRDMKIILLNN